MRVCTSVQFSHSVVSDSATSWIAARQASLSITNSRSSLKLKSIKSVMPSNHLISFSISPSNDYSGLISFRVDWFDLLAVQGTFNSLLQYHSLKASVLWCSSFFMVQLSHPYMTTGKTIALTRQIFVSKVMSLLFNTLSKLVISFLSRSKRLLISWLQSSVVV